MPAIPMKIFLEMSIVKVANLSAILTPYFTSHFTALNVRYFNFSEK